jgi:hypothetical protein
MLSGLTTPGLGDGRDGVEHEGSDNGVGKGSEVYEGSSTAQHGVEEPDGVWKPVGVIYVVPDAECSMPFTLLVRWGRQGK